MMAALPILDRSDIIVRTCAYVAAGDDASARATIARDYPPPGLSTPRGQRTELRLLRIFLRDGFTDRYFAARLVFPGALRVLSLLMPDEFPYHPNWKQSETHQAFWELYPTIDHVTPLARGGTDDDVNIVTTSMLLNGTKANWRVDELRWPTERAAISPNWDGMLGWFMDQWNANLSLCESAYVRRWHRAAVRLKAPT
jgi:hypothetical protein